MAIAQPLPDSTKGTARLRLGVAMYLKYERKSRGNMLPRP